MSASTVRKVAPTGATTSTAIEARALRPATAGALLGAETPLFTAQRLHSLDTFRGITVAAMILVNNPGTSRHGYRMLRHAQWNGLHPADLIFPFFLFIAGVAITFSVATHLRHGAQRHALFTKIVRRSLIIAGLGLLLNALPYFDWEIVRLPGVLQRIALCYFCAATVVLFTAPLGQVIFSTAIPIAYWAVMTLVPVPGYGAGVLDPDANLAAYVDRALMGGHLWHREWDPEGLLSTVPAVATTLAGVLAGHWLRAARGTLRPLSALFAAGGAAVGLIWNVWFPINKTLWTSSYVVLTAGAAVIALGLCYWLIDLKGYRRWAVPFVVFGTNPILAYGLSSLMSKLLVLWPVTRPDGSQLMLKTYLFQTLFLPLATRRQAALLYAVAYTLFWLALMSVLYRKRIFIKI